MLFSGDVSVIMSTAKRLVLSLRGRKESHGVAGTSSTRLVSANSTSPGHELDEIAVVSGIGAESGHVSYGSLSLGHTNGPRYIPAPPDRWIRIVKGTFSVTSSTRAVRLLPAEHLVLRGGGSRHA
uniref:Uncharacterized protein n=1 Tax=Anopheles albimanus TaxID=7167 RepID=A0A182FCL0_ANOAL